MVARLLFSTVACFSVARSQFGFWEKPHLVKRMSQRRRVSSLMASRICRTLDHARADGDARLLQGVVAHAMAMLAEEGQLPLDLGPVRRRGAVAKVASARITLATPQGS